MKQNKKVQISEALTWDEVGEIYGGRYRTKSMDHVFESVKKRDNIFFDKKEGTLHRIIKQENENEK